jgi:hypothetical protein
MRIDRALLLCVTLLAACRSGHGAPSAGQGSLSASWIGSDTGKIAARPRAAWCPDARRLELFAEKGDQGLGLVLYPAGELQPGSYPVFDPRADSLRRPGVAAAVRWFTERSMAAYQSDSGGLELERAGSELAGSFGIRMRGLVEGRAVRLTGRFSGVKPGPCPPSDSVTAPAHPQ